MKSFSYKYTLSVIAIGLFLFNTSCKNEVVDITKPVITMAEPTEGASYSLADDPEVHMEFTATDEASLHELTVELKDASGTVVFSDAPEVHDLKTYAYHEHYEPSGITSEVNMTFTVTAEDHGSNVTTQTINFKVKP